MFLFYFLLLYFLCFLRDRRGGHWGNSRGGSERQESQDWRAHSSRAIVNFFLVTTAGRWSTRTTGWPTCPKPPEFSHVKVCGQWLGWSYLATRVFTQVLSPIEKAPVKHALCQTFLLRRCSPQIRISPLRETFLLRRCSPQIRISPLRETFLLRRCSP